MFQRKGPWFRMETLVFYEELLHRWDEDADVKVRMFRLQEALEELYASGYISGVRNLAVPGAECLLDAAANCMKANELRLLLRRVFRAAAPAGQTRRDALRELRKAVLEQRTLSAYFSPASTRVAGVRDSAILITCPKFIFFLLYGRISSIFCSSLFFSFQFFFHSLPVSCIICHASTRFAIPP